ncbi:DUF4129 domain-containing protein [Pseudokineococcus basanitobsidens]|uniref:DUF4129 domain-containing protein n=1 Tax=Pseudokineococcus basanitobsidens TaxID=1926649 RepID=A0ABU8RM16_9ACTN
MPPPGDVSREEAQDLLLRELSGGVYQEAQPSLLRRALTWLLERLGELLPDNLDAGPVVDVVVVVVVAALVLVALRVAGQVVLRRRRRAEPVEVFGGTSRRSADEHRRAADERAAARDWPGAVAERFRAVVRGAEERVLLDERPGRTSTEAAAEMGAALPGVAEDLRAGARTFEDVVYGSAPGSADDDARLRALDARVRAARPAREVAPAAQDGAPR